MTRPRVTILCAAAIVVAYVAIVTAMAVAPAAMAKGVPGIPALPRVVAVHAALFVAVLIATVSVSRGIGE